MPLSSGYATAAPGKLMVILHDALVPLLTTFRLELFTEAFAPANDAAFPLSNETHRSWANDIAVHTKTKTEQVKIALKKFL